MERSRIFGAGIQWSVSFPADVADRSRGWRVVAGCREPECGERHCRRVESRAHRDVPADDAVVVGAAGVRAATTTNGMEYDPLHTLLQQYCSYPMKITHEEI